MGGSSFDQITQALLQQQQVMQDLQAQNNQLRQQLHDLRCGRGIFVLINGTRLSLDELSVSSHPLPTAEVAPTASTAPTTPIAPITPAASSEPEKQVDAPTAAENTVPADSEMSPQEKTMIVPSAEPTPAATPSEATETTETTGDAAQSAFLEDLMLSEFTSALTSPLQAQAGPATPDAEPPDATDEDKEAKQQSDLRRALMGSYVLD